MRETSKCQLMRETRGDFDLMLKGHGIDIGCGDDPLRVKEGVVDKWDLPQGDAQYLTRREDQLYDFAYSSHCLEHMVDVPIALRNWTRILKPGGYLYLVVPDYTLYEHHCWPSKYNPDHKQSFSTSICRLQVARKNHWHITEDLTPLLCKLDCPIKNVTLEDIGYNYNRGDIDQTLGDALAQICIIARRI